VKLLTPIADVLKVQNAHQCHVLSDAEYR